MFYNVIISKNIAVAVDHDTRTQASCAPVLLFHAATTAATLSEEALHKFLHAVVLIFVLLTDGTTKLHAPGSLWEPSKTEWIPENALVNVPIAFGLFMAGVSICLNAPIGTQC